MAAGGTATYGKVFRVEDAYRDALGCPGGG
jgi:hypothetical protein